MQPAPHAPLPDGHEAAFDRLFAAYYTRLRRYAFRYVRSWEEAEDVVHDVLAQLWSRRADLASVGHIESYLYTATRNRALSRLKHRGHEDRWQARELTSRQGLPQAAPGPDAEEQLARAELGATIQRSLDTLTPRQREVILRQWRGATYEEIGTALGISPKTVSVHISRAFGALREILTPLLK